VINELGLTKIPTKPHKSASTKIAPLSATLPVRLPSSRKRKAVSGYSDNWNDSTAADESEYDGSGDEDDDDEPQQRKTRGGGGGGGKGGHIPLPKHTRRLAVKGGGASITTLATTNRSSESGGPIGGIVCEAAKTGRATCRRCRVTIDKDKPRVGMQAWIVGRQALTWQCPRCFLGNLLLAHEKSSGRGRCKASGEAFAAGELKVGARSHTATHFYKVTSVGALIVAVGALEARHDADAWRTTAKGLVADSLEGHGALTVQERAAIASLLATAVAKVERGAADSAVQVKEEEDTALGGKSTSAVAAKNVLVGCVAAVGSQPKVGTKSGATGRVEWKWGGLVCSGVLLPSQETATHCFARTHKGNTKTLAKGNGYWAIVG